MGDVPQTAASLILAVARAKNGVCKEAIPERAS